MQDVADRVGMSRQLVSIVLRGAPGASEASKDRILAAARELGYHPDDSARMLRRRHSGQIGVLFTMRQPFEVDLVEALYRRAGDYGFSLALSTMGSARSQETALAELMRQRIEALIVLDSGDGDNEGFTPPPGVPTLLLGGPTSHEPHDSVGVENRAGIGLAIAHLTNLGHRHIAYIGPEQGPNAAGRLSGYQHAMRDLNLTEFVEPSDYTEAGGHSAALRILATRDTDMTSSPTALVCVNDHCAIGALQTLVRAGVRVPEDISVIGFDDSSAANLPFVQLTSVSLDPDQMAKLAISAVQGRLESPGAAPTITWVTPTLVERASTAPPVR